MFQSGQQIGNYTLINRLGRGGFGEVWLAEKRAKFVTTKVAVKLPLDEQIDHEAIEQEATLWEQASGHPNILPIIDADEYDGQVVIVSEYAPDGSLEQWLRENGKMSVERAIETTIQILNGLEFLHSRNIIHRDLKPANILLQGKTPRLADFGISRALRTTVTSQSQNISGTFAYMSPEALDGKRSTQTDIWSVGVNLYQFLTGTLPFPHPEPSQLLTAIMMRDYNTLPDLIPKNLQTVIAKALSKQSDTRYKSANEMREDLRRTLRGENVSDFVQTELPKTQASFPKAEIPPTQKSFPVSLSNIQSETETVVHPVLTYKNNKEFKPKDVWMIATVALFLVSAIGIGIYFSKNSLSSSNTDDNTANPVKENILNNVNSYSNSNEINTKTDVVSNNQTAPSPEPSPDKTQLQKMLNQYIGTVVKNLNQNDEQGFRYINDSKNVTYSDIDKDGDLDAVADLGFREKQSGHITTINNRLVIFSNTNGQFSFLTDIDPGQVGYDPMTVKNGKILLTEYGWNSDDPGCCPSIRNKVAYSLIGGKLEKVKR